MKNITKQFKLRNVRLGLVLLAAGLAIWFDRARVHVDTPVAPDRVEGRARLVDGDSFHLSGHEVRLVGIDAPEGRQTCQRNGQLWRCGEAATQRLRDLIGGRQIGCDITRRDQHDRLLATCWRDRTNLNREMIRAGYAVAFGKRYRSDERAARQAQRGLWSSQFERPQAWRRKNM